MKKNIIIMFVAAAVIIGIWFILKAKQPAQKPAQVLYVELTELNHDTFKDKFLMHESISARWPFYLKDGKLSVDKGVVQSIKDGRNIEEYRLFVDKKGLDIQKEAKLFLIHNISYNGVGRESADADYYIFSSFPAKITLPSLDTASGKVHLTLDDSISNTLKIRIFSDGELLIGKAKPGEAIEASYAGTKFRILAAQEQLLSKDSRTLTLTQETFAPVPKGEITEKDINLQTVEYGTVEFSTELKAKNYGLCKADVAE